MKTSKHLLCLLIATISVAVHAQNSSWSTTGNSPNPNSFIGTTNNRPLILKTNGAERMAIDPAGKVTISRLASADTAALVVLADGSLAKATDPGNGGTDCKLLLWDGDGNASSPNCFIGTTNAMAFPIHTNGIERMRVTPDGNVVVQGFGAKAPFQVFDHIGVTFNRRDIGAADVYRSIGFNLFQDGSVQRHYQAGTAAKMEFASATGLLQLSVTSSQQANTQATFPAGIQLDQYGRAGIGAQPDGADILAVGGVLRVQQAVNPANSLRMSHNGTNAVLETNGNSVVVRSQNGSLSIDRIGNGNNFLRLGHNGNHAFMETGGNANARLKINTQSAKMMEVGGDALFDQFVGIGTTNFLDNATGKDYRLAVNGRIRATEIKVYSGWADHVFGPDYALMPLAEVEAYIAAHGHLPGVPSAGEVEQNGVDLGATQAMLLEKIEELTLHLIKLEKENMALRSEMDAMRSK